VGAQLRGGRVSTAFGRGLRLGSGSGVCRAACAGQGAGTQLSPAQTASPALSAAAGSAAQCYFSLPAPRTWRAGSQQTHRAERSETGNTLQTEICGLRLDRSNTEAIHQLAGEFFLKHKIAVLPALKCVINHCVLLCSLKALE